MTRKTFKILTNESTIEWTGKKVTGSHNGTIAIKEGELFVRDGKLIEGTVVVDTTNITVLDIFEAKFKEPFAAHLASDDFFSSARFPESVLRMVTANGKNIDATLTIKGITHPIRFDAEVTIKGDDLTATAKLVVDRTKYDMKFRSGNFFTNLGDTLIYDNFELIVSIAARSAKRPFSILV